MGKKRRLDSAPDAAQSQPDTSKPTATFTPRGGRKWTLSIALPGSIIANAKSRELQALLSAQIARASAVFCVDEIIVFDDGNFTPPPSHNGSQANHDTYNGFSDPNYFLAHILSYLECPPYMRTSLFPRHPDFQHSGMLPSLDMPHHSRQAEGCRWREGVTLEQQRGVAGGTTAVNVGFDEPVHVEGEIPPYTRVTVRCESDAEAEAVAPAEPREKDGWYWGYSVRVADSLSTVLTECPFDGGYDLTFGTSERGRPVAEIAGDDSVPDFNHLLIVFGGVAGLEVAVKADKELKQLDLKYPEKLFDYWVNLVPGQGSRTIRTEEAVWLGLMAIRDTASSKGIE